MKHLSLAAVVLMVSQLAFAWGTLGHHSSAQIAWNNFDSETRSKINTILKGDDFVKSSVWADAARRMPEFQHTGPYHYEKVPDNYTYLSNLKRLSPDERRLGGPVQAMYIAEDVLKDQSAYATDRKNALKFLIHYIGDLHQPLHTGRVDDNGGNKVPVSWLGLKTNLHSVWDSQIIFLAYQNKLGTSNEAAQAFNYAIHLQNKFKNTNVQPEMLGGYDEWMHESMAPRTDAYEYINDSEEAYTSRFIDGIDLRVYLAGMRMAYTLKRILTTESSTNPLDQLRDGIKKVIGDFTKFVSLKPNHDQPVAILNK